MVFKVFIVKELRQISIFFYSFLGVKASQHKRRKRSMSSFINGLACYLLTIMLVSSRT